MATPNLENLQGDLFSRGFPKYKETYYFFSIVPGREQEFTKYLGQLGGSGQISSLKKVLEDWTTIECTPRDFIIDISNALIAFTKAGLDKIQLGLPDKKSLGLENLKKSDPAFARGMRKDGPMNLNDPPHDQWDAPFNSNQIHGILKVAGKSQELINRRLDVVKSILAYPTVITDVAAPSGSTEANSRCDGKLRPRELGLKGHEHFGFRDGVSEPLLKGIDTDAAFKKATKMETAQNIITVTEKPPSAQDGGSGIDARKRPLWMVDGSFLVFRKLEQDVQKFIDLTEKHAATAHCANPDHFGAKLMGRWKSGAPIVLNADHEPTDKDKDPVADNNFDFKKTGPNICPVGAHIRKTNPRDDMPKTEKSRMVRNGIPYGEEFSTHRDEKRGLLFACYQSSIDNGFQFIQKTWCNNPLFPHPHNNTTTGHDPFIGQPAPGQELHFTMFDKDNKDVNPPVGPLQQLVTMRGGEYFFVPSISALSNVLGSAAE